MAVAKTFGITRPTLDAVLEAYPIEEEVKITRAEARAKRRAESLEKTVGFENLKNYYLQKPHMVDRHKPTIELAWQMLQRKDPTLWNLKDYAFLWGHPDFKDEVTGEIDSGRAMGIRAVMHSNDHRDALKRFGQPAKRPPQRKQWFLRKEDLLKIGEIVEEPDVLLLILLGVQFGARMSSLKQIQVGDIDFDLKMASTYEPKVKKSVNRFISPKTCEILKDFIQRYDLKKTDRLFYWSNTTYLNRLQKYGKAIRLEFPFGTHVLKHTFVTQASKGGVSMHYVSEQAGTDPGTLKQFYLSIDPRSMRRQLFDEHDPTFESYGQWIGEIAEAYAKRYEEIKDHAIREDGIKVGGREPKKKKPKKKRKPPTLTPQAMLEIASNPSTKPGLASYWAKQILAHPEASGELKQKAQALLQGRKSS